MKTCDVCKTNKDVTCDLFQKIEHQDNHRNYPSGDVEFYYDACDTCHQLITNKVKSILEAITLEDILDELKTST